MTKRKIRVGVVFGGRSGEHEVSLMSARSVLDAIDKERYEVVPIGITKTGRWLPPGRAQRLLTGESPSEASETGTSMVVSSLSETLQEPLDVVFPVLHGPHGEDGTMQGFLELANVPYVGAGVLGSALGMDKGKQKEVLRYHGLPVGEWAVLRRWQWRDDHDAALKD